MAKHIVRLQVLMSARHRAMLDQLAERHEMSKGAVLRRLIERAHELQEAAGRASGAGWAEGRSAKPPS